jgi:acetyltransferase-like isoleucine patch superfamily enzyme
MPSARELRRLRRDHPLSTFEVHPTVTFGTAFRVVTFGAAQLIVEEGVTFRHNCLIELDHQSVVRIGAGTTITYNVVLQATKGITIGRDCLFANGASVVDSKHTFRDVVDAQGHRALTASPITIGDGVWISSKATVGADVGERSVVAANAAVVRPVEPYTLVGGTPARVLDRIERDLRPLRRGPTGPSRRRRWPAGPGSPVRTATAGPRGTTGRARGAAAVARRACPAGRWG